MPTGSLDLKMTLENSGFLTNMTKARESAEKAVSAFKTLALGVTGLGAAFGALQGIDAFAEGIRGAFEQGRELQVLSRQTSQSVGDLVELRKAFTLAGLSADQVERAVFMLQKALGGVNEEGMPTTQAFNRIGLSIEHLKGLSAVQQFQAIAEGLKRLPDPATRSAVAMQMFGRSAMDVQGLLNDPTAFTEAINANQTYARVMQQNAAAFEQLDKTVDAVQGKVKGFYAGVAAGIAPGLQALLDSLNKIDLAGIGVKIGRSISLVFEAFKDGKIGEILGISLTVAFKQAINVMYGGIFGLAGALQVEFQHIPQMLRDAFSMLTNPSFWKGIGQLLLGAFLSIQGRLAAVFIYAADALGHRLADVIQHIPRFGKEIADAMRADLDAGTKVAEGLAQKTSAQGDAMAVAGAGNIAGAAAPVARDYLATMQAEINAFAGAYQANKAFDIGPDLAKLRGVLSKLAQAMPKGDAGTGTGNAPGTTTQQSRMLLDYKQPEADRLAKVGLFVGSSPASPGLSEARRTANATERMSKSMDQLVAKGSISGYKGAVYAE